MNRRKYLALFGGAATASLAGCSGLSAEEDEPDAVLRAVVKDLDFGVEGEVGVVMAVVRGEDVIDEVRLSLDDFPDEPPEEGDVYDMKFEKL